MIRKTEKASVGRAIGMAMDLDGAKTRRTIFQTIEMHHRASVRQRWPSLPKALAWLVYLSNLVLFLLLASGNLFVCVESREGSRTRIGSRSAFTLTVFGTCNPKMLSMKFYI